MGCGDQPQEPTGGAGGTTTTAPAGGGGSGGTGGDTGGTGGTGATGGTGGTGGAMVCTPGETMDCYDGPEGTKDVGACKGGLQTCDAEGQGYGECTDQVLPAAEEDCTTPEDDDCDGEANEADAGCVCTPGETMGCYEGPDGTEGVGLCVGGQTTCDPDGKGWGPCDGQVLPAAETCNTPGDDDCDGETNEDGAGCGCVPGSVAVCYSGPPATAGVGACKTGMQMCNDMGTGYGPCMGEITPVAETCNTPVDDDCDGEVNEGGAGCVCPPNQMVSCYDGPAGTAGVGACKTGLAQCNDQGTVLGGCVGDVVPVPETCNTPVDDDCDGQTNESGAGCVCLPNSVAPCYTGPAGTEGVGACTGGMKTCNAQGTAYGACTGEVLPVAEVCGNFVDENCNGQANEGCPLVSYATDVKPIFANRCGPCHTGNGSGGHNIGLNYADTQLASYYCPGHTKGYCALVRIQDGSMPAGNPGSVPAAEQATIQAWIAGGQQP
ncbi:MAG: hypothetical protein R3B70_02965 [Polyangiaceae bacterium]